MQIDPLTLKFLRELQANNHKPWFVANKERYDFALQDMKTLVNEDLLPALQKKDMIEKANVFRIYNNVRFSKDKTPYKNHLGAGFRRATASLRGGYYLHVQPGDASYVGGGFWSPSATDMKRIRDEFVSDTKTIIEIQKDKTFMSFFGSIKGSGVKTAPRGYSIEEPLIELIKKKQWVVIRKFSDEQVLDPSFSQEVSKTFAAMRPYFDYMSQVLTTNLDGESII